MFSAWGLLVALLAASVQGHFQPQLKFSPFNWLLKSSARSGSVSAAPVKVSVYYESLCPDSQLFVYDQLAPTFEIFGPEELVVDLKPFGKANWTESNGSWDFTCQHGPRECYNNKVQACILNQVPNTEEHVPLIGCIMSTGVIGSEDACLEELGITTTSPDAISGCADSDEGSSLLHDLGVATHGLNPPLTFVPWVIFNDEFNEDHWQMSLIDLKKVLCDNYLSNSDKC